MRAGTTRLVRFRTRSSDATAASLGARLRATLPGVRGGASVAPLPPGQLHGAAPAGQQALAVAVDHRGGLPAPGPQDPRRRDEPLPERPGQPQGLALAAALAPVHALEHMPHRRALQGPAAPDGAVRRRDAGDVAPYRGRCAQLRHGVDEGGDRPGAGRQRPQSALPAPCAEDGQVRTHRPLGVCAERTPCDRGDPPVLLGNGFAGAWRPSSTRWRRGAHPPPCGAMSPASRSPTARSATARRCRVRRCGLRSSMHRARGRRQGQAHGLTAPLRERLLASSGAGREVERGMRGASSARCSKAACRTAPTPLRTARQVRQHPAPPGRDLTLSAPKSVSLAALIGRDTRVAGARDPALAAAIALVQAQRRRDTDEGPEYGTHGPHTRPEDGHRFLPAQHFPHRPPQPA